MGEVRIAGYAAVYDRVDRAGDVFRLGVFGGARAGAVPLLVQHRGRTAGRILTLEEDARGLRVTAVVNDPGVARLVRARALPGFSVGYRPLVVAQGAWREIRHAALAEVSLVAVPMQAAALVERVDEVVDRG